MFKWHFKLTNTLRRTHQQRDSPNGLRNYRAPQSDGSGIENLREGSEDVVRDNDSAPNPATMAESEAIQIRVVSATNTIP